MEEDKKPQKQTFDIEKILPLLKDNGNQEENLAGLLVHFFLKLSSFASFTVPHHGPLFSSLNLIFSFVASSQTSRRPQACTGS
jgi:hypothetical protein